MAETKFVPMEKELGKRLMQLRGEKTQETVAETIGVRRETIKQWENAERHIKAVDLVKLSAYYNVSVDYLLGLSDKMSISADVQIAQETLGLSNEAVKKIVYINEYLSDAGTLGMLNKILEADKLIETLAMVQLERKRVTDSLVGSTVALEAVTENKNGEYTIDYAANEFMSELEREVEFAAYKAGQYFKDVIDQALRVDVFKAINDLVTTIPKCRGQEDADAEEE